MNRFQILVQVVLIGLLHNQIIGMNKSDQYSFKKRNSDESFAIPPTSSVSLDFDGAVKRTQELRKQIEILQREERDNRWFEQSEFYFYTWSGNNLKKNLLEKRRITNMGKNFFLSDIHSRQSQQYFYAPEHMVVYLNNRRMFNEKVRPLFTSKSEEECYHARLQAIIRLKNAQSNGVAEQFSDTAHLSAQEALHPKDDLAHNLQRHKKRFHQNLLIILNLHTKLEDVD